ncbi:MAG TPA: hypothetical protein DG048_11245 [Pseudoalteromonas sp.]|nr:hypothetical protein [Pseudoalteromonas sp.]|tara:strand:- start:3946 stop:4161 length:216 start_codon:yes stop_codon:yes gene_type:complete
MAKQVTAGWLTMQQAAVYLGVSIRALKYAVALKKRNKANQSLILKSFGNRTLICKQSLDDIQKIFIHAPKH